MTPATPRKRKPRRTPQQLAAAKRRADARLKVIYGLQDGDYDRMLEAQGGVCFLCGKKPRARRLAVDHDHETNRVRGLLCLRCNRSLGVFEWDVAVLERLISYAQAIIADRQSHG